MGKQQWCLRVNRQGAEDIRRQLLEEGILDRTLKIRPEGEGLLFPITSRQEGAIQAEFEELHQRAELPRHELIGGIAVLAENDPAGAAIILADRPSVHTALIAESAVEGEFRTKRFRVLAGKETTATTHTEYGRTFRIDLEKAYFSARLASERQRILCMMNEGETVLDMFTGVGPFAIILSVKAEAVWACDLNPDAVSLLIENITMNRVSNVIPILADAGNLPALCGRRFDRVIMNLPLMADRFLPAACSLCVPGGTIHFYALIEDDAEENPLFNQIPVRSIERRFVRSYAPGRSHVVYDINIR
ncbi:MAG: class I SAM-dependent methyltransferase family protein [Methanospirillum sp.]|uniref:class I SAM-dependent methyltransferase n=1 Tax=Methanospirillum sp. TaxID=45200 RepID=UPI00236EF94E|nr:class I SAM-dependent methyltransferase family protein [Methanospirillum sp.]MDD1728736.1 class I SAM-dependent methyltransferase family protein [Methanospirillum sp.]